MAAKNIIVISKGIIHPPVTGRIALRRTLRRLVRSGRLRSFREVRSFQALLRPRILEDCSAILVYVHEKAISTQALAVFDGFVRAGGGVLAIHSASASFKKTPRYSEIIGGSFRGHGTVEMLDIRPRDPPGPEAADDPFRGIAGFETRDELYIHEHSPGIRRHFVCRHDGADVPVVWTHLLGAGRVCCASLGHLGSTMRNAAYQRVLEKGLAWASG